MTPTEQHLSALLERIWAGFASVNRHHRDHHHAGEPMPVDAAAWDAACAWAEYQEWRKEAVAPPPCPACGQPRRWDLAPVGGLDAVCECGRRGCFDNRRDVQALLRAQKETRDADR